MLGALVVNPVFRMDRDYAGFMNEIRREISLQKLVLRSGLFISPGIGLPGGDGEPGLTLGKDD